MSEEEGQEEGEGEDEEIELPDEDAEELGDITYIYGLAMPVLPEGMQPLECVILIKGIMMESGQPTITAMGSEGMTPWEAVGMMQMEAQRLVNGYSFGGIGTGFFDDDDDEEEEEEDD